MATPVAERADPKTRQVRVSDDLAEKCAWLARFADGTVADFLDPILRPVIEERYARVASRVEIIKAAESGEPLPGHAPDLGENGGA